MSVEGNPLSWGRMGRPASEREGDRDAEETSERANARLTKHERQTVERMLERGKRGAARSPVSWPCAL